ncbi:hypothetical protein Rhopal_001940-T1 [Rhodotorula paludigena]|uniref:MFS general substrate transporter n=1 Tax=Rhodotorula paludigena TaxID=86838 RepID=A0AAV5GIE1_9BASI|nr:hypothetical protein Rhopal_001940-T1 [Rhodotorula paludigena]
MAVVQEPLSPPHPDYARLALASSSDESDTASSPPSRRSARANEAADERPVVLEDLTCATVVDFSQGDEVKAKELDSDEETAVGQQRDEPPSKAPTGVRLALLMLTLLLVEIIVDGSAYLLTCVAFQPLFGRAYAFFPQKWVFLLALSIFFLGCIVAAVAPSSTVFILGRAIQGLGYAGLFIGILAIAANTLPIRMQAIITSLMNLSYGTGTVLVTTSVGWRWIFWILTICCGLPLALGTWLLNPPLIPQTLSVRQRLFRMDWGGAALLLGSMICLLIALQEGGISSPWSSSKMIGLLVGSGALFIAFLALQTWLGEKSSISMRLLTRDRSLAATSLVNWTCGASFFALLYFIPIWFQTVQAASPIRAGVCLLPLIFLNMTCGIIAGWLVSHFGFFHPPMLFGCVFTSIGAGLHATMDQGTTTAQWAGYGVVIGAGMGALYMMSFLASQTLAKPADKSKAASLVCFTQILGGTIWVSASNAIYANKFKNGIELIPGVDVAAVLASGVDRFREVVEPEQLPAVVDVSVEALWNVFTSCAIIAAVGALAVGGIRWVKMDEPGKEKKVDGEA